MRLLRQRRARRRRRDGAARQRRGNRDARRPHGRPRPRAARPARRVEARDERPRAARRIPAAPSSGTALDPDAAHVGGERWTRDDGLRATRAMLAAEHPPTAIVSSQRRARARRDPRLPRARAPHPRRRRPRHLRRRVLRRAARPAADRGRLRPSEVGRRAAELLVEAMGDGDPPREDVRIPVTLVARRSCGCRRERVRPRDPARRRHEALRHRTSPCARPTSRSPRASSSACSGRRAAARRRR